MNIYKENGYSDRQDYLECLAEDYGVSFSIVKSIADLYGESEDFDGLVAALDDLDYNQFSD